MKRFLSTMACCLFALAINAGLESACAPPPPNITPDAQTAWKQHEIQKDLDLIRDLAQDAAAQTPPVISIKSAAVITAWHRTAIVIVHDQPAGWRQQLLDGLSGLQANLPAADYAKIQMYVSVAYAAVKGYQ